MTADHLAVYATRETAYAHLQAEHDNAFAEAYGVRVANATVDLVRAHRFLHGHLQPHRIRKEPA
jgi:hypothetical protein